MPIKKKSPKKSVDVFMTTYNHELYIRQAIESVLEQHHADFTYRLIIGDDGSTDATAEIVKKYAIAYPDKISALCHQRNIGAKNNMRSIISLSRAKYVALLEGDDYWISPEKIKTLFYILETYPNYSGCFHLCLSKDNRGLEIGEIPSKEIRQSIGKKNTPKGINGEINLSDIVMNGGLVATSSVMYRREIFDNLPECYFRKGIIGDVLLAVFAAEKAPLAFVEKLMSVYRYQAIGASFSTLSYPERQKKNIRLWEVVKNYLDAEYADTINDKISGKYFNLSKYWLDNNDPPQAKKAYYSYLKYRKTYKYTTYSTALNQYSRIIKESERKHFLPKTHQNLLKIQ